MRTIGRLMPALLACLAWPGGVRSQDGEPLPVQTILVRAAAYVTAYQQQLGAVIAEEHYVQRSSQPAGYRSNPGAPGGRPQQVPIMKVVARELRSDFLMLRLPAGDDLWVGFRDVYEVDRRPIRDREQRFAKVFADAASDPVGQWKRLNDESARFNLGNIGRNFNVPTLPLIFLHEGHRTRTRFDLRGRTRVDGTETVVLEFREHSGPTAIKGAAGSNVFARGKFWIAPADGRVLRSELRASARDGHARIVVNYAIHDRWGILVPMAMDETYENNVGTRVDCRARYTNFRRFEVAVKVR